MSTKILLAEDDPIIAKLVVHKMRKEGYDVDHVDDGGKALKAVQEKDYSLIILDVVMPVFDGFQVLGKIKADDTTAQIPVVMLTSKGHERDVLMGLRRGAIDYLTKPFNPSELAMRVRRILDYAQEIRRHGS